MKAQEPENGKVEIPFIGPEQSAGERSEPERSGGPMNGAPDPEVSDRPRRRRFTAEYKRGIVREAARCTKSGEIGVLLRRKGLYSSHLADWRREFEKGGTSALAPKKRGRTAKEADPAEKRVEDLERENRRLTERLRQAEVIIDVQKKVSQMLGISLPTSDDERRGS